MQNLLKITLVSSLLILSACENEPKTNLQDSLASSGSANSASILKTLSINAASQAVDSDPTDTPTSNLYDPGNAIVPSAIDILFKDSLDGTINVSFSPNEATDPKAAAKRVLNDMDGFSTSVPLTTGFSSGLDPAYANPANIPAGAVRIFEVGLSGFAKAVVSVKSELTYGVDFIATLSSIDPLQTTLVIVPLKPLKPDTSYYTVITNSLKDANGDSVTPSAIYSLAKSSTAKYVNDAGVSQLTGVPDASAQTLESLRQLISASEFTVDFAKEDLAATNIVVSWSFTTQSVGKTLATVRSLAASSSPATSLSAFVGVTTSSIPGGKGLANIYTGTLTVPYYLTESESTTTLPNAINTKHWEAANAFGGETKLTRHNTLPAATNAALDIPLLVTTPVDTTTYPAPWKTVIFQHGITTNRTVMLAVADTLASVGFAVVAIDMPLHGLVDTISPFYQASNERTFNVDIATEGGLVTIPATDGTIDSSGKHFINLSNLLVTRDNVRQAIADLFTLTAAISTIDVDGNGADLDASNIYFVGHSLGGMVGTAFLALEPNVKDAVLVHSGNGYAKVLDGSAAFSSTIVAGLRAATANTVDKLASGVDAANRASYESFIGLAQIAVDTADPINHSAAAATGRGILFFEIVGNGTPGTSDLVVPNTVPDANDQLDIFGPSGVTLSAPLAGTEAQLKLMGLTQVNSSQMGTNLKLSVKFTEGDHGSILSPVSSLAVTTEMQKEMASFLATGGNALSVTDATVIQVPTP